MIECLDELGGWRRAGSLQFNPGKTEIMAVSWVMQLDGLTELGTHGETAAQHEEREALGNSVNSCTAPSGTAFSPSEAGKAARV